jgi:hypothetical protein
MLVLGVALLFLLDAWPFVRIRASTMAWATAGIIFLMLSGLIFLFVYTDSLAFNRIITTVQGFFAGHLRLEEGDLTRFKRIVTGCAISVSTPFGGMFPLEKSGSSHRVLITESGFLDIAARGGWIPAAALVALLVDAVLNCRREAARAKQTSELRADYWYWRGLSVCVICLGFANLWINASTEPYFGPLFWFLIGNSTAPLGAVSAFPCVQDGRDLGEHSTWTHADDH